MVGECEETKAMMVNVDCIYADVSKGQMPSDERIELIPCKLTGIHCRYIYKTMFRKKKKKKHDVTMKGIPYSIPPPILRFFKAIH